jgi:hypothetical protein
MGSAHQPRTLSRRLSWGSTGLASTAPPAGSWLPPIPDRKARLHQPSGHFGLSASRGHRCPSRAHYWLGQSSPELRENRQTDPHGLPQKPWLQKSAGNQPEVSFFIAMVFLEPPAVRPIPQHVTNSLDICGISCHHQTCAVFPSSAGGHRLVHLPVRRRCDGSEAFYGQSHGCQVPASAAIPCRS